VTPLENAYQYCRSKAFGHYENFPVASLLLPPQARDAIAAVYAFARSADDFADEPGFGPLKRRLGLLRAWQANLSREPVLPEFLALQDACARHAIPIQLLKDLISAFLQDCVKSRYADFPEVLDYCRRSANPIGRLVLRICGRDDEQGLQESDAICTALQLANFWQDLASDARLRDRIYLPRDEMHRFGVSEDDLRQGAAGGALRELMRFQVERAETLFVLGEGLPSRLGGRLGAEIRLTVLGGRRILEKIRAQGYDTLASRPHLRVQDAPALAWRMATGSPL
jgi:squalene synthase HpnC